MSDAPEDFEKLRKLLKLKRHEVPPPGYFDHFSSRVLDGIEANGPAASIFDIGWIRRAFALLETNPIAAGLFGMSVCGLLISGIAFSQGGVRPEYSADTLSPVNVAAVNAPDWTHVRVDSTTPSINPVFNTNAPASLFGGLDHLSVQQVNYTP